MKKIILLVSVLCMLATFAYAASEWNFYGSARVMTQYTSTETPPATTDTDAYRQWLAGTSRIGAKVKANDALTGGFEYGSTPDLRLLWGEWNFGAGSLLVGQQWTPLNIAYSNQVWESDNGLGGFGDTSSGRAPMLRLAFGDFQIAVVATNISVNNIGFGTTEIDVPAIEAYYRINMDTFHIQMAGGYQSFNILNGGNSYDVNAYVVSAGAGVDYNSLSLMGSFFVGRNAGNLIDVFPGSNDGLADFASGTSVVDNDAFGFNLVATYKVNDMFAFEAGYGYVETKYDTAGSTKNDMNSYYLQSTITLAPGVMIVPEIGRVDYKQSGQDGITYVAAKWQMDF